MSQKRILTSLGHKIKSSRVAAGYSQKELAKALKISDKSISAYEVNRAQPSLSTLRKIAKVVNQPLSLFTEEEMNDLASKVAKIEQELAEIKKLLTDSPQSSH
ncbi:MAG TPA: helix-turn-helix transcriptional regulator [Patescibacteria group bacterium]